MDFISPTRCCNFGLDNINFGDFFDQKEKKSLYIPNICSNFAADFGFTKNIE